MSLGISSQRPMGRSWKSSSRGPYELPTTKMTDNKTSTTGLLYQLSWESLEQRRKERRYEKFGEYDEEHNFPTFMSENQSKLATATSYHTITSATIRGVSLLKQPSTGTRLIATISAMVFIRLSKIAKCLIDYLMIAKT